MNLPKVNSIRTDEIKFGKDRIVIRPWSNRDMVNYEDRRDKMMETDDYTTADRFQQKYMIDNLIYEILVKPNIVETTREQLSYYERNVLFIKQYKISRGTQIPVGVTCQVETCKHRSEVMFNIDKNVTFEPFKPRTITTKDFKFELKNSTWVPEGDGSLDAKFMASWIKTVEHNGNKTIVTDIDELAEWIDVELDEKNFDELREKIFEATPKIIMKMDVKCEMCGDETQYVFYDIPDFSIVAL